MKFSNLMDRLESGIFNELAKEKASLLSRGVDVIDLSVGTPNIPPAASIKNAISAEAEKDGSYVYALGDIPELKKAASRWYGERYGVDIDPETEVCSVLGTQEGLVHCCLPLVNPGDTVILPDPCYPAFYTGAALANADVFWAKQRPEKGFLIDFADIPKDVAKKAKLIIVSYPNNPTTATAPDSFYRDLISFAKQNDIFVIHDNAYSELAFDGLRLGSFLAFEGAKDIGAEFNSLSKTFGFAGARLGFCFGNSEYIGMLKRFKSNTDFGVFLPIQKAGVNALQCGPGVIKDTAAEYEKRRNIFIESFAEAGWSITPPKATMFVWARIPEKFGGDDLCFGRMLAQKTGVIVVPGSAFGAGGSGYVRMALVQSEQRIRLAAQRIKTFLRDGNMNIIESERLAFRLMEQTDLAALYDIWGNAETMRFCGGVVQKARIKEIIELDRGNYSKYGNAVFAVASKDTGELLGVCGGKLDEADPLNVEVIIHFNKASRGKGYGTEAVAAYVSWVREYKKAVSVCASAHPDNSASINMLKKCGFIQKGFKQFEDTGFVDEPYFEIPL
jgi:LL-diaminopimelate aminotransferase